MLEHSTFNFQRRPNRETGKLEIAKLGRRLAPVFRADIMVGDEFPGRRGACPGLAHSRPFGPSATRRTAKSGGSGAGRAELADGSQSTEGGDYSPSNKWLMETSKPGSRTEAAVSLLHAGRTLKSAKPDRGRNQLPSGVPDRSPTRAIRQCRHWEAVYDSRSERPLVPVPRP